MFSNQGQAESMIFIFSPIYTAFEWDEFETLKGEKSLFGILHDRYETSVEIETFHNTNQ